MTPSTSETIPRGKNTKPGPRVLRSYWRDLRAAADAGDIPAKAILIALAEGRPLLASVSKAGE